jgi:hypothetical protein
MARIALKCDCGWNFFVPGSTPGWEITCPSCTRLVSIPGRTPGMDAPLSPGELAAKIQRRHAVLRNLTILVGLGVAGTAAFILKKPAPPAEVPAPGSGNAVARPRPPQEPPTIAAPRSAPAASARNPQLRRRVLEQVWLANMGSIVSECLRFRNLAREWSQMQSVVASYEKRIKADLEDLAALKETVPLEPYFAEGDRIVAFGRRDFSVLRRADAAQVLQTWMVAWRAGAAVEQVQVLREDRPLTLYLQFPEDTKELLLLLRHPSLQLDPLPDREPAMAAPGSNSVEQTVAIIATEVAAQTEVFGEVISEMRRRTEPLTTSTIPVWPDESAHGIALIQNPLSFQPGELSAGLTLEIGKWWNPLTRNERIRFATYFGLWCAQTRGRQEKK